MITEDYVSFETAKLLKEKGFMDGAIIKFFASGYDKNGHILSIRDTELDDYPRPTLQMAMKWLRKVHKINITIGYTYKADANLTDDYVSYCFEAENAKTLIYHAQNEWYGTYEQACETAIKYCLENLI